jgi:hypothetical protein
MGDTISLRNQVRCGACWQYYDQNNEHACPTIPPAMFWQVQHFVFMPNWERAVAVFLDSLGAAADTAKVLPDAVMGRVVVWWREG